MNPSLPPVLGIAQRDFLTRAQASPREFRGAGSRTRRETAHFGMPWESLYGIAGISLRWILHVDAPGWRAGTL